MKKTQLFVLIILMSTVVSAQSINKVFDFSFTISKNDSVGVQRFAVIEGVTNIQTIDDGKFEIRILSSNDTLYRSKFNIAFTVHREILKENGTIVGEEVELNSVKSSLRLPFFAEATKLQLLHNDKVILGQNIILCNKNNICENFIGENYLSCPSDCFSGSPDDYCDRILDGRCDPDCSVKELDIDCTCGNSICSERESPQTCPADCKKETTNSIIFIIIFVVFIALIAIIVKNRK